MLQHVVTGANTKIPYGRHVIAGGKKLKACPDGEAFNDVVFIPSSTETSKTASRHVDSSVPIFQSWESSLMWFRMEIQLYLSLILQIFYCIGYSQLKVSCVLHK
jgi:hypothetical protein